jgi:hypothetical protein
MDDILLSIRVDGVDDLRKAAENMERFGKVAPRIAAAYDPVGKQVFRILEANKKLSQTYKVLEGEQKRYAAMLKADKISLSEYKAQLELLDRAMNQARREAEEYIKTDKELIAQQKKAAAAAKFRAQREEELYRKYAPARAAADQYQAELLDIEAAYERNIINLDEYNEALSRTKKDFELFTKGLATGGNQFAKFNVETYKSAQRLKRHFNQGVQQAGYQLGDFIVQVQSGQSALVALGQQGSQFAGIFGPTGAVVGAIIAGGTAAALAFQEYFGSLEGASKAVDKLNSSLDAFVSKARETYNSTKSIKEEYGDLTEELVNLAERAQEIRLRQVVLDAEELADSLKVTSNQFNRMFKGKTTADTTRNLQYMFKELSEASGPVEALEVIRRINEEVSRVGRGTENMTQAQLDFYSAGVAAEQAYEKVVRVLDLVPSKILQNEQAELDKNKALTEAEARRIDQRFKKEAEVFSQTVGISKELLGREKELSESEARRIDQRFEKEAQLFRQTVGMSDETKRRAEELEADERARLEYKAQAQAALLEENSKYEAEQDKARQKAMEDQNKLNLASRLALSIQLIKNEALAAEVAAKEAAARKDENAAALQQAANEAAIKTAGEIAYLKERARGVSTEIAQAARIAAEEEERGRIALAAAAAEGRDLDAALRAAASAMASLTGFTSSLEKRLEVARAKVEAIKSGANEAAAAAEAGFKFEAAEKYQEALGAARGPEEIAAANQEYQRQLELIGQIRTEEQAAADEAEARRGKGGGGGASKERLKEAMKEFEELRTYLQNAEELNRYYGMSEIQILNDKYAERQRILQESLQKEYLTEQQYKEMLLVLEQDYQNKKKGLAVQTTQAYTSAIGGILSSFASMQDGQSKKSFEKQKKLRKAAAVVEGIGATIAAYRDGMEKGGPILATVQAAAAVAATAAQIKAIDSATFSGGGGRASVSAPTSSTSAPAQRVLIQGLRPNDLITGSQLSEIFDRLYEENENRGLVFQIAS